MDKTKMARQFTEAIPHARALGMQFEMLGDGVAEMSLAYDERFIGDPSTGVLHGGVVFALLDTCCGAAVISHSSNPGATATIDLRVDYMRAATPGQTIRAHAQCYHITRSVAFVRATATDENTDLPVATATGSFTVDAK